MDLKSLKNCHRKRFSLCVFLASWSAWLWICGKVDSKNRQITMWWIETLHLESLSTFLMYHTWHFIWMERVQLTGVTQRNYTSQLTAPASMSHHLRRSQYSLVLWLSVHSSNTVQPAGGAAELGQRFLSWVFLPVLRGRDRPTPGHCTGSNLNIIKYYLSEQKLVK